MTTEEKVKDKLKKETCPDCGKKAEACAVLGAAIRFICRKCDKKWDADVNEPV